MGNVSAEGSDECLCGRSTATLANQESGSTIRACPGRWTGKPQPSATTSANTGRSPPGTARRRQAAARSSADIWRKFPARVVSRLSPSSAACRCESAAITPFTTARPSGVAMNERAESFDRRSRHAVDREEESVLLEIAVALGEAKPARSRKRSKRRSKRLRLEAAFNGGILYASWEDRPVDTW